MGRVYVSTGGQSCGANGNAETGICITGHAGRIAKILRLRVSQHTHGTSEQYQLVLQYASVAGTGGANVAAAPVEPDQGAAGAVCHINPTAEPTYTADTEMVKTRWNSLTGKDIIFPLGQEPVIGPGDIMGAWCKSDNAADTAFVPSIEITFEEIG